MISGFDILATEIGSSGRRPRRSINSFRSRLNGPLDCFEDSDKVKSDDLRLAEDEAVYLAGFVLLKVYTPSTRNDLVRAVESLPYSSDEHRARAHRILRQGGSPVAMPNLPTLTKLQRDPGNLSDGTARDSSIPAAIDCVRISLMTPVTSLRIVSAVFTFSVSAGNLSDLLRSELASEARNLQFHREGIGGYLSRVLPFIPWDGVRATVDVFEPEDLRREAFDRRTSELEATCECWFRSYFKRALGDGLDLPTLAVPLFLTDKRRPFADDYQPFNSIGLGSSLNVWTDRRGSGLSLTEPVIGRYALEVGYSRASACKFDQSRRGELSNAEIVEEFYEGHMAVLWLWASGFVLAKHIEGLKFLRERLQESFRSRSRRGGMSAFLSGKQLFLSSVRHAIAAAEDLDDYLTRTGMDAATVTVDLERAASASVTPFTLHMSKYGYEIRGGGPSDRPELELSMNWTKNLNMACSRFKHDREATMSHISTQAQLQQTTSNLILQHRITLLTYLAIIIAVISVLVSIAK